MARTFPTLPAKAALNAGDYAELALLEMLERGLPDIYSLFHSVDWSRGEGASEQHGEIDIIVINQAGDVLLIEVKAGNLEFTPTGIFKDYHGDRKNITAQIGLQYGALRGRLRDTNLQVKLSHYLVIPNHKVESETVLWPRERIVDSEDLEHLVSRIATQLGPGLPAPDVHARVMAFFLNRFKVALDVSALAGRIQESASRMAAGLATWVPRISAPSGLIRVIGTAGSGKTQLALQLLRQADRDGLKSAYICFNRPLADHLSRLAPVRTPVETFHEYAARVVRAAGQVIDFERPDTFDLITGECIRLLEVAPPDLDFLVLDEMQDLQPEWVLALLSRLKVDAKAYLLEDPEQQLYKDRIAFDLPDAITVTSHENFRTPRALVKLINALGLTDTEVEARATHSGEFSDPLVYDSTEELVSQTSQAIARCLQRGFGIADIVVVSMRGRERSVLQKLDTLGQWTVKRFTGKYDPGSASIWTEGEVLIDSVRRFKGQAAPAIVLTECDITELDALNRRLLFCGLTRARMHLEWVISKSTATVLEQKFRNSDSQPPNH